MNYYIIIPAHNEEAFLASTLDSILDQTLLPQKVFLVNDNSTDTTEDIMDSFTAQNGIFQKINITSSSTHMPGSKVINAFNKGLGKIPASYGFLVKLDADIILPDNYFEKISTIFKNNPKIGIAGGFAYEQNTDGKWYLNHPMNNDHVRGAFKAYTQACFTAIGGLKSAMGWDTVDELLARYHGFDIYTEETLKVKHLRPTGNAYNSKAKYLQGKAMYRMRYGFWISFIASAKMAWKQRNVQSLFDNIQGYLSSKKGKDSFLVAKEEGDFIRSLRWRNIKKKLFR
ncbi:glycosyltransferase family 2 protein [Flavobacteriaceae bacterium F89]|uniref:Glycosyltransferase family 2 protein n=1 Tax=Cerina litoralis TaxID=2874477 RepID=A0AAE3JQ49_9FLAO|nr:glycosyltransferase family 2 protein [Cerina litoralis]MCG2461731.1 glycosyltransferase family 2 protein [Cerina litoralis]